MTLLTGRRGSTGKKFETVKKRDRFAEVLFKAEEFFDFAELVFILFADLFRLLRVRVLVRKIQPVQNPARHIWHHLLRTGWNFHFHFLLGASASQSTQLYHFDGRFRAVGADGDCVINVIELLRRSVRDNRIV